MRTYLLILSLLLMHCFANAQKIHFTDTTNKWRTRFTAGGWGGFIGHKEWYFESFVTKNGITYASVKNLGLCREDTLLNKVYVIITNDTVERILYDYTLQIGDTFSYAFFNLPYDDRKGVVTTIDSILIGGNYHKRWKFNNLNATPEPYYYTSIIIEGVGAMKWSRLDETKRVICFERNGTMIPIDGYTDTNTCALNVAAINAIGKTITISPNPANQYSKITFPYTIQSGQLIIIDVLGKTVSSKTIANKSEITIGEMPASGIYFYQLKDLINNQSYTGKFIYE